MIRCSALRLLAIAAAVALIPALTGCAAGLNAQTNQPFDSTDGASTVFHDIAIRNVFVLAPNANVPLQPGQSASMFLALVNRGNPDRLTAVSAPDTATSVTIHGGTVLVTQNRPALLTGPEPQLVVNGFIRPVASGQFIVVTLTFQNAGTVALIVPVMPPLSFYATFSPPPPTPTPTPTRRPLPSLRPSPARTGSARATPAPSATP